MTDADKTRIEIEKEPYFLLSKNEFGKTWLMHRPSGDGRYNCWWPIDEEFWQEFEKLQSATVWSERLKQERNKAIDECIATISKFKKRPMIIAKEALESLKDKSE